MFLLKTTFENLSYFTFSSECLFVLFRFDMKQCDASPMSETANQSYKWYFFNPSADCRLTFFQEHLTQIKETEGAVVQ